MRALPTLAVLVLLGASASPAAAAWREQRLASGSAQGIDPPQLAGNARGDTAVAWRAGQRAFLAVRKARASRFGRRIELRRFSSPHVAVLSDGTVLVASLDHDGTQGGRRACCQVAYVQRLRPGSRRPSAPRIATPRGASLSPFGLSLSAGPGGRAALIGSGDGISLVTSRAGGVFGLPAWPSLGRSGSEPFVGFGGDGRGAALWVEGQNHEQRLRGVPIARDGGVGAVRTFVGTIDPRADFDFFALDAGLDRRSRLTALWVGTGNIGGSSPPSVRVATGPVAAGRLTGVQVLDENPGLGNGVSSPDLAVASNGRAIAAWRRYQASTQTQVVAIRARASDRFRVLAPLAGSGTDPQVAVLAGGQAILVAGGPVATARIVQANGRIGSPRLLRGAPQSGAVGIVGAAGRITVAWGTRSGLRTATYTPAR